MHPKALDNYNTKLIHISQKIEVIKMEPIDNNPKPKPKPKTNDCYVSGVITAKDIQSLKISYSDYLGNEIGFYFIFDNCKYQLLRDSFNDLINILLKLNNEIEYKLLSIKYLTEIYKDWIEISIRTNSNETYLEYLNNLFEKEIKEYTIIVPIHNMFTESNFKLGNIQIYNMSPTIIDKWFSESDKSDENILNHIEKFKKDHQGYIAAAYSVKAEKNKAMEMAYDKINDAFMVLRIFSMSNLKITVKSYIDLNSWKLSEVNHTLIIDKNTQELVSNKTSIVNNVNVDPIANETIHYLTNSSLSSFSDLIRIENKNNYQSKLYDSLQIYSKHTIQKEIYDKLLYVLVSLESLIIKNETEPLTQNISERIAFIVGNTADERVKIVKLIKKIYGLRSRYVHHGKQPIDQMEVLDEFLHVVWVFYTILVQNINRFETINDFLEVIENKKYS
ncbi:MAG: HEPN domain-containing protein [Spirochaetaceae bacterium]